MAGKREEQMKEITKRLEQGVQELFTSEKYMNYLKTMSQFHNYSFNNTLLISMQKPEATLVAGFSSWNKKFNRRVKQGEKGIKIIAPAPIRKKEEIEKFDPVTNEPILKPDGQPETEEVVHIIPRFCVATVFDISQTYGDPIPELDTPELLGSVENFPVFMEAIERTSPVPMHYEEIEGESKGYYSSTDKEIAIQEGMSEMQTMKTAVHEVTHAMCHDRDIMEELGEKKNRMTKEVEAESVAYTVCSCFGLDTSDYSFPYIAGWSSDKEIKELRSSMDFIRKTAGSFIDSMVENMQELQKEKEAMQDVVINENEGLLYTDTTDRYAIFQIDEDGKGRDYLFLGIDYIKDHGIEIDGSDYSLVYSGRLEKNDNLDTIYERFNINHPEGYTGHSLSVSDVVVINRDGKASAHFVDSFGFTELPDFIHQRGQLIGIEAADQEQEETIYPPVYTHTLAYAMAHGKVDDHFESRKQNIDCKKAVETAIRENFDGLRLEKGAVDSVLEEYGAERLTFILANTVQYLEHDGRFSRNTKEWANGFKISENIVRGTDLNQDYVITSHPAVLDGFIGFAREKMQEHNLQQETTVLINEETRGFTVDGHFGTWHTAGVREIRGEMLYLMEHDEYEDSVASVIVNQEGKLVAEDLEHGFDKGAMDAINEYFAEKGVADEQKTSFIAQYYVLHEAYGEDSDNKYEYFEDWKEALKAYHRIPNHVDKSIGMESTEQPSSKMSLIECRNGVEKPANIDISSISGEWLRDETIEALQRAKEYFENRETELAYELKDGYFSIHTASEGYDYTVYGKDFREIDGGIYEDSDISIREAMETILSDEGIAVAGCKVMDYEELQEAVNRVAQEDIQKEQEKIQEKAQLISDRAEPETALNGCSCADIEETVLSYAQAQIDDMGLEGEVELLGARVYGSRSREGLYHEGSDIDVVVSYSGSEALKEDDFFNMLHEDGLKIAGILVDINPISTEKTGTLEKYMEKAEKYLDEKQKTIEMSKEVTPETGERISFYVAECMEFHVLGEYHEQVETLQEAMDLYEKIPAERMSGVKGIGFCLEDGSIYDGMPQDLMRLGRLETDLVNEISHYKNSALVQKTIAELETILAEQSAKKITEPEKKPEKELEQKMEKKPEKADEAVPKDDSSISAGSKKQSVLNALRERQERMKAQDKEKQGQKTQSRRKGELEL
ncbi:DUF3849 domain-containing protein [Lachnospiraceae bacterium MD308]|nr:DUF3849 domain-containing protein [Lachnospiraceae bacterium MD308]